jgi:hypothetical protein
MNLIQNVLSILDIMQECLAQPEAEPPSNAPSSYTGPSPYGRTSVDSTLSDITLASTARRAINIALTQKHRVLNMRLSPLREVEDDLRKRLGAADPEFTFANGEDGVLNGVTGAVPHKSRGEFGVRGWIGALGLPTGTRKSDDAPMSVDEPTEILATLRDDIISLWEDAEVRELLRANGVRIEDRPGLSVVLFLALPWLTCSVQFLVRHCPHYQQDVRPVGQRRGASAAPHPRRPRMAHQVRKQ